MGFTWVCPVCVGVYKLRISIAADTLLVFLLFLPAAMNSGILPMIQADPPMTRMGSSSKGMFPGAAMAIMVIPLPSNIHAGVLWFLLLVR